jgi:Uma2 family endonuclease
MSTTLQTVTAEELFTRRKDGFRYELVKGELRKMSPSGSEHAVIIGRLTVRLGHHVEANNLGLYFGAEAGFKIASDPDTVRAPDLAFVSRERVPESGVPKNFWTGAPDLAVEVVSPGDTYNEVEEKVEQWLTAGARAVWIVNPRRRNVTVYRSLTNVTRLSESDDLDGGDVVPGFRCKVSEIFV